ncbi:hypothetical protein H0H92_013599, partial [Tricholoma furcatifolium]
GTLRKRFGNALLWYNALKDVVASFLDARLNQTRALNDGLNTHDESGDHTPPSQEDDSLSNPFADPAPRVRPSDHLRSRCPLCFGGSGGEQNEHEWFDVIVCLDACFTQKRNRQQRDPPLTHPHTVFVNEAQVNQFEAYIESVRPSRAPPSKEKRNVPSDEDHFEGSLRVPKSILDGCEASFTAADSR